MSTPGTARGLALACHPLPTVAVTVLSLLLAIGSGTAREVTVVVAAVLCGQLVIGWHNDLVDAARDRAAGRSDKPLALGAVSPRTVRAAVLTALTLTVVLSLVAGGWAGLVLHVGPVVGSGLAYNAGLKATVWSWLPYAVAFGTLPAFVWLSVGRGAAPWWVVAVGALLGVGAHLLNVLPDLEEDLRHGIRGLPHRLGGRWSRVLAPLLLLAGTVLLAVEPAGPTPAWAWVAVGAAVVLTVPASTAGGRAPFLAAIGIALLNVTLLALVD
ncbi:UbiA family prenyltransferase [Ornithinimicrobium sp. F0845]|uniref:UbiA family prenyltransferase n=1 Tax=Ornithinimicrobium sp. F0845 TaxID=2926412 RepID=UPI001FF23250|nr:UbiA family prenyltransferase [Ornithinimicrobium sp. F0845]